jgi:hypothetical protein
MANYGSVYFDIDMIYDKDVLMKYCINVFHDHILNIKLINKYIINIKKIIDIKNKNENKFNKKMLNVIDNKCIKMTKNIIPILIQSEISCDKFDKLNRRLTIINYQIYIKKTNNNCIHKQKENNNNDNNKNNNKNNNNNNKNNNKKLNRKKLNRKIKEKKKREKLEESKICVICDYKNAKYYELFLHICNYIYDSNKYNFKTIIEYFKIIKKKYPKFVNNMYNIDYLINSYDKYKTMTKKEIDILLTYANVSVCIYNLFPDDIYTNTYKEIDEHYIKYNHEDPNLYKKFPEYNFLKNPDLSEYNDLIKYDGLD